MFRRPGSGETTRPPPLYKQHRVKFDPSSKTPFGAMTTAAKSTKNRYEVFPLHGSEPYGYRSSEAEAEAFAVRCAAHLNLEVCVRDRQTGSLWVYDPWRQGWFCQG
jgi:hypothetical protein